MRIASNELTLSPANADDDGDLPVWDGDRRVVAFDAAVSPPLTDDWAPATLADGRPVEIRSAACGGGCRCAGEYRFPA